MKRARVPARLLAYLMAATAAVPAARASEVDSGGSPAPAQNSPANLVHLDVVVQDRDGRSVANLSTSDFEVQEDGRRVRVERAAFTDISVPGAGRGPRAFIVMFDRQRLSPGTFARAKRAATALFTTQWVAGDVGVVVIDGQAATASLIPNQDELLRTVEQIAPAPGIAAHTVDLRDWPQLTEAEVLRVAGGDLATLTVVTARACDDDPSQCPAADGSRIAEQAVRNKASRLAAALHGTSGRVVVEMLNLVTQLERVEGRKAILLLSENLAADAASPEVQQTIAAAARANARVYTLSAAGDSTDALAAGTGGLAARSINDLDGLIPQIGRDASTYYVVSYVPDRPPDGTFRRVSVTVKRRGLVARARRGYVAVRASELTAESRPSLASLADATGAAASVDPIEDHPPVVAAPPATTLDGIVVPASPEAESRTILRLRPTVASNVSALAGGAALESAAAAGWDAYQRGDLETARTRLTPAAGRPEAPSWVHYVLGTANFALRYFDDAVTEWERVNAMEPQFEPVYFDLFDAYIQTRQHDKALRLLRAARARWPRDPDVFNALATLQGADGALDDAVKTLQAALAVAPNDATTYFNMGKALELRYVRSRKYFWQTRAWIGNEDDRQKAIKSYERYLELKGQYPDLAREALERLRAFSSTSRQ